jgi:hypothetical protein
MFPRQRFVGSRRQLHQNLHDLGFKVVNLISLAQGVYLRLNRPLSDPKISLQRDNPGTERAKSVRSPR